MRRPRPFVAALRGLVVAWQGEPNLRFEVWAGYTALAWAALVPLPRADTLWVIAVVGLVWTAELLNTAVEATVDLVTGEWRPAAGLAKDFAAAGVLLASLLALAVGLVIFGPHLGELPGTLVRAARSAPWGFGLGAAAWAALGLSWLLGPRRRVDPRERKRR
ncbi:MAG: diacylglycerol kinase family protein [Firmicutes bacterium]|nr:diacylglycerol kinase family protein [Bacillota bacterium]